MSEQIEIVQRSTLQDLVDACGCPLADWTGVDHSAAGVLMGKYTAAQLVTYATVTSRALHEDTVYPSEILRTVR